MAELVPAIQARLVSDVEPSGTSASRRVDITREGAGRSAPRGTAVLARHLRRSVAASHRHCRKAGVPGADWAGGREV